MHNVCTVIRSLTRIGFTCSAALLLSTAFAQDFQSHPSTQDASVKVTLETLARWEDELSNWGRWGPDDQRGTLNLITAQKTKQAAALVQPGETVTLPHFVTTEPPAIDTSAFTPTPL